MSKLVVVNLEWLNAIINCNHFVCPPDVIDCPTDENEIAIDCGDCWLQSEADELKELTEAQERAGEEWISVDDGLPEVNVDVLMRVTCCSSFNAEQGQYKGDNRWVNCWCSTRDKDLYPVTHWMPLPEAPQQEGSKDE